MAYIFSGAVELYPAFQLDKRGECYGRNNVCQISTDTEQLVLSTEDEKIYHLFSFFIQTQAQLRETLEGLYSHEDIIPLA